VILQVPRYAIAMWRNIGLWSLATLILCVASAVLLHMQPMGSKPGLVNRFAGITIGRGFRLIRRWRLTGPRQLVAATFAAWLMWSVLGGLAIALFAPGYDPGRMFLIYGLLCGVVGAIVGLAIGVAGGAWYAKATNMSSFEGKSGYFVMLIGLLGGILGGLICGIGMTLYFRSQGQ
jgi:hypothetical protein